MAQDVYKPYIFRDRDPILDQFQAIFEDAHVKISQVSEVAEYGENGQRVARTTLYNWLNNKTISPKHCTIAAAAAALGYRSVLQKVGSGFITAPTKRKRKSKRKAPARQVEIRASA